MSTVKSKEDLKLILNRVRAEHKRIFGEELAKGELNGFFSALLEFKRRKWIEGALADNSAEEVISFLEIMDSEDEPNEKAE